MEGPDADSTTHGTVRAVCVSKRKGTRKTVVDGPVTIEAHHGVAEDAHAGDWHRQVSLLAWESIKKAQARGLDVKEGDFAENFCTEGIDVMHMPMGTQVKIGEDVIVEISQIGKVCHTRCAIYYLAGDCIFPREGIFGVVLQGGTVKPGDTLEVLKVGDGTCEYSPADAIAEVEEARRNGTL
ncbi:MAG: sulfurase [Slackia sp.]|nr:sulfurase [Slackia sp.]